MACPFLLKGQHIYSFLDTVRFLELALKNVFVPINDFRETLPQFDAPYNAILLIKSCNSIIPETTYSAHSNYCGLEQKSSDHCISNE